MNPQELPGQLQDFLAQHISSVAQLELLLLLHSTAPRPWTAADLARELRIDTLGAQAQADDLCLRGLLACGRQTPVHYWYQPVDQHRAAGVQLLADLYADRRVSIISFIYSRPVDQIKLFADAFRLRKDKPNG